MIRKCLSLVSAAALLASLLVVAGATVALANTSVNGAAFTTTNTSDTAGDGTGHCKNGNEAVNCNIYDGKQYVWLNGGPVAASLSDGTYFFAVLDPGGQGGHNNPNDGTPKDLSDLSPTTNTGAGDAYTNRTFSVSNGVISYSGTHDFYSNKIRLMGYDDTINPGGVYILAICSLGDGYPVDPSACKYDAFKVQTGSCDVNCGGGGQGVALTIVKDAAGSNDRTYSWTIDKSADDSTVKTAGGADGSANYTVSVGYDGGDVSNVAVAGTISVFNPNVDDQLNTIPVTIDAVTDALSDGSSCTVTGGGSQALTDFETDFAYTCALGGLPATELDNTATVTWSDQDLNDGSSLIGDSADFTFTNITFENETAIDDCVSVDDNHAGHLGDVCVGDDNPTTFNYSATVSGHAGTCTDNVNTASYTTDDSGTTDSDSATVSDCQGADLTVTKTAVPSFTRTYNWNITKNVDKTRVEQIGGSATFNYTVTVAPTGYTDSGWQVNGTITVHNPNNWESVTLTGVSDAIDNGGICVVSGNTTQTIAAGGDSTGLTYSCTYASAPSPASGTNTATAYWDSSAASTTNGSAQGQATADFSSATPTLKDTCVDVTDKFNGGTAVGLGHVCVGNSPAASNLNPSGLSNFHESYSAPTFTFTYSRTIAVPATDCKSYTNIAKYTTNDTGTTDTASKTVTVCGPAKTGALTMGFWKNTNGQGLIGTYCINGTNNLGNYLKGLGAGAGPFSNAPTTCSGLKTFVTGILNGASATDMNKMLKAQMLASALDVWFSGPGWTSTQPKGAPKPPSNFLSHNSLGGFVMDMTAICPMVDNLTAGTATCTAGKPSTNAYASGAVPNASMSMQSILDFASTVKATAPWTTGSFTGTATSSTWYGTNRALQEVLKNIFDQFNNGLAFAG